MAVASTLRMVETPINYYLDPEAGGERSKIHHLIQGTFSPQPMPVSDIRGRENDFTLDRQGFQLVTHEYKHSTLNDEITRTEVYPECAELVKNV